MTSILQDGIPVLKVGNQIPISNLIFSPYKNSHITWLASGFDLKGNFFGGKEPGESSIRLFYYWECYVMKNWKIFAVAHLSNAQLKSLEYEYQSTGSCLLYNNK